MFYWNPKYCRNLPACKHHLRRYQSCWSRIWCHRWLSLSTDSKRTTVPLCRTACRSLQPRQFQVCYCNVAIGIYVLHTWYSVFRYISDISRQILESHGISIEFRALLLSESIIKQRNIFIFSRFNFYGYTAKH